MSNSDDRRLVQIERAGWLMWLMAFALILALAVAVFGAGLVIVQMPTPTGDPSPCCSRLYWPKKSMVLSLVRRMPACSPRIRPNRHSRPISAPESSPRKSSSRLPKSPWPSGRPNRCVTRNELANRGIRSVVGRPMIVKSGCAGFTARSLGAG